jgi:hypothetical protein
VKHPAHQLLVAGAVLVCRSRRTSRWRMVRRSVLATSSRRCRARPRRPRTSPAVCRAWPSCSRRASPRTRGRLRDRRHRQLRQGHQGQAQGRHRDPRGRRAQRVPDPEGKHISVHEGEYVRAGEALMDGAVNPHDILKVLGEKELALPRRRDPGGVPAPGRAHQRQAHRGDRAADAAPRPGHATWATPTSWSTSRSRSTSSRRRTSASSWPGAAGQGRAAAARHHQGVAVDRVVHLGVVLPGDHQGAHRGRDQAARWTTSAASRRT